MNSFFWHTLRRGRLSYRKDQEGSGCAIGQENKFHREKRKNPMNYPAGAGQWPSVIDWVRAKVTAILRSTEALQKVEVRLLSSGGAEGERAEAIYYPSRTIPFLCPGDEVLLNTEAVRLGLGTGGYHFVGAVLHREALGRKGNRCDSPGAAGEPKPFAVHSAAADSTARGHIMKLRYTPFQHAVFSAEEKGHPFHEKLKTADDLLQTPVIAAGLHSMVVPILGALQLTAPCRIRAAYVMTDGGACPLAFSDTIRYLRQEGLLCGTVTAGHAFGGDLEAVNLYSGLLAAKYALDADVILVAMGPGIVGTGTMFGHTGIEQGLVVNATHTLGGSPIAPLRVSFADRRRRHGPGVSHHTVTSLGRVALVPAHIAVPLEPEETAARIHAQLQTSGLAKRHVVHRVKVPALDAFHPEMKRWMRSMGRTAQDDPAFFQFAAAAGVLAAKFLATP
jgi:hypothetical protein